MAVGRGRLSGVSELDWISGVNGAGFAGLGLSDANGSSLCSVHIPSLGGVNGLGFTGVNRRNSVGDARSSGLTGFVVLTWPALIVALRLRASVARLFASSLKSSKDLSSERGASRIPDG